MANLWRFTIFVIVFNIHMLIFLDSSVVVITAKHVCLMGAVGGDDISQVSGVFRSYESAHCSGHTALLDTELSWAKLSLTTNGYSCVHHLNHIKFAIVSLPTIRHDTGQESASHIRAVIARSPPTCAPQRSTLRSWKRNILKISSRCYHEPGHLVLWCKVWDCEPSLDWCTGQLWVVVWDMTVSVDSI